MSARRVNIHVERIIVAGPRFNMRETAQFRSAFEREVGALLQGRPVRPAYNASHRRLDSPEPIQHASKHPEAFAAQVARRFFETLRDSL